ncbi:Transcriptional regulator KdgR [bioreactor metagenome]|uniref:Transcriptional regulator KdgR n=1 Tax=bioreactor metagenome TaxID=1076179 RepID=A0A644XSK0_9ZZZZ
MKKDVIAIAELSRKEGTTIQSVARAMEILRCFEDSAELGISEISDCMGLSKSTIYGLVNTLTGYGFLEQSDQNKKYRLGLRLFELGALVQRRMDIRREAHPWCQLLADKYLTTVHLAAYSDGEVIYVDKVDNTNSVVVYSQIGKRAPMYCTGVGKAMATFLPLDYLEKYIFSRPMTKMTDNTITSREALLAEFDKIRSRGYAVDNEEIEPGLQCIAAPIFNYSKVPQMAISVSFPYGRLRDLRLEDVAEDVIHHANMISQRLGYPVTNR